MITNLETLSERCAAMDAVAEIHALEILSRAPRTHLEFVVTPLRTLVVEVTRNPAGECTGFENVGELWVHGGAQ